MERVFFSIGPITIYWYSIMILLALVIGYSIIIRYCKKEGMDSSIISDMLCYLVVFSILGARVYYVLFNFSLFKDDLIGIFKIWNGGIAIYGAIIAGVIYIYYYCKKNNINFIKMLDIFSLSLLLGQAIGRWGNFFNSEAYGGITSYSALKDLMIPEFIIRGMYIDGAYREPTFLYESLWCLLGVVILFIIRKKYSKVIGRQLYFYLMWYGIGRCFIEGLRSDSLYFYGFRISQIVSIIIIIIGIIGSIRVSLKNKVKDIGDLK